MKKMLLVLIPVLLLGAAFASFAASTHRLEVVGLQTSEPIPDVEALSDPFQGGGVQGLNQCRIECRQAYIDCKEIFCPGPGCITCQCPECDTEYQACLANC